MGEILDFTQELEKSSPIKINPDFKDLLKPLTEHAFETLEKNILSDGCRDALVLWDGFIVDGHNRYHICSKHNLPFETIHKTFESEAHARIWIRDNQLGRRDLLPAERIKLVMDNANEMEQLKEEKRKNAGKRTDLVNENKDFSDNPCQPADRGYETNQDKQKRWNKNRFDSQVAQKADVSRDTVHKYRTIIDQGTTEEIEAMHSGKEPIKPIYEKIRHREKTQTSKKLFSHKDYSVIYVEPFERDRNDLEIGWTERYLPVELEAIPMKEFLDEQAALFLWTPPNMLEESLKLMKSWGFEYSTMFIGRNEDPFKDAYNSIDHQLLLVGSYGGDFQQIDSLTSSYLPDDYHGSSRHEFARQLIESMYGEGNKLDFFDGDPDQDWDKCLAAI